VDFMSIYAAKTKKRVICMILTLSIVIGITMPANFFTAKATDNSKLNEIPDFKDDWKWLTNTDADTVDELDDSSGGQTNAELLEIEDFKDGWNYKVNVTESDVLTTEANTSGWTANAKLPAGNAGSSSSQCKTYIETYGTTVGASGSAQNIVLKKTINITNPDQYAGFFMDAIIDDGAVVFVNGEEAIRFNADKKATDGTSGIRLFGYERRYVINDPVEQVNKSTYEKFFINKDMFDNGNNVITIAILQDTTTSGDILFDGMLYAIPDGFKDITPSDSSIAFGDEWIWVKNDPGNDEWLSDDFIAAETEDKYSYKSNSWRVNNSSFGFDTNNNTGRTITTQIPTNAAADASNANHQTNNVYLRRIIEINDVANISNAASDELTMKINRIRNIAVYINEEKIYEVTSETGNSYRNDEIKIPVTKLKNGRNIIGVDMRNTAATSTSIYFDMEFPIEYDNASQTSSPIATFNASSVAWESTEATLPVGNASSSSELENYITTENGTNIGESGSTRNLVLQKEIAFTQTELDNCDGFVMDAKVDDGAVVFVNGEEAVRFNAYKSGTGTSGKRLFGYENRYGIANPVTLVNKSNYEKHFISKDLFIDGDNVITVAVLNNAVNDDDIFFDGMLYTIDNSYEDITPSGAEFNYGAEWLWIKSDPGNDLWLSDEFKGVDVADKTTYRSNSWRTGETPIGYATNSSGNALTLSDFRTIVPFSVGDDARPLQTSDAVNTPIENVHLRRIVNINKTDLANKDIENVYLTVDHRRGLKVYLNGTQIHNRAGSGDTRYEDTITIPVSSFIDGKNIISVVMINTAISSTNMIFDAKLIFGEILPSKAFSMSLGKDESELGFLWYTPKDGFASTGAAVQIAKTSDYNINGFTDDDIVSGEMSVIDSSWMVNKVIVTDLESGTEYTYRYGNTEENLWSEIYTFKTGNNADNGENKAIFVGDPTIGGATGLASTKKTWERNLAAAEKQVPDATYILSAGDNANDSDSHYFTLKEAEQFKRLPFASTVGNHETSALKNHFIFPNLTNYGTTICGSDYYFSQGNTLYIAINSMSGNIAEHKQAVQEAVASYPDAKWRVVLTHFGIYAAGPHSALVFNYWPEEIKNLRNNLVPVFEEYDIDIVLNGHEHSYTRSCFMKEQQPLKDQIIDNDGAFVNPNGILYITASCGSDARFYEVYRSLDWVAYADETQKPQFTELNITNDSFKITTYFADSLNVVDTVTIKKEAKSMKDDLRDEITNTKNILNAAPIGNNPGHPQSANDALNAAIIAAEAVLSNAVATGEEIAAAITALNNAIDIFNAAVIPYTYTVTYNANGGSGTAPTEIGKNPGDKFTAMASTFIPPANKQFNGWNTAANGSGTPYAEGATITMPANNLTLYAQWVDIPLETHTVIFKDGYDNVPITTQTVEHGKNATPPSNPTRTGYTFDGWDKAYTNITVNTVITAKWKINTYTVTFKDGSKVLTTTKAKSVEYNRTITAPTKPKKSGYTFIGWYASTSYTTKFDFTKEKITKDINVYAYFVKNYAAPSKFKVTKPKAKSLKLSWTKKNGYSYEVQWSKKKKSGFKKLKITSKNTVTKSGLKKGKTYYFKVRAYKKVNGVTVYGKYTIVKSKKA